MPWPPTCFPRPVATTESRTQTNATRAWLLAALLPMALPAAADIYSFVSKDGIVHLANHPVNPRYRLVARDITRAEDAPLPPPGATPLPPPGAASEPAPRYEEPSRVAAAEAAPLAAPEPPRACVDAHALDLKRCRELPADGEALACETRVEEDYLRCADSAAR